MNRLSTFISFALLFTNSLAAKVAYTNATAFKLHDWIVQSQKYQEQVRTGLYSFKNQDLEELSISEINQLYHYLKREGNLIDQLLELKFQMVFWRKQTAQFLLDTLARYEYPTPEQFLPITTELLKLRPALDRDQLGVLNSRIPYQDKPSIRAFLKLVAEQGRADFNKLFLAPFKKGPIKQYSGPQVELTQDISGFKMLKLEKWAGSEEYGSEFSQYTPIYDEHDNKVGVQFRGMNFISGDLLIVHFNTEGDGMFSMVTDPPAYITHVAMFAMLTHEGRSYPAVVEMSLLGVRAVPLASFLDPKLTSYIEVFRLDHEEKAKAKGSISWAKKVNKVALQALAEDKGYDFEGDEVDRRYISCAELINYFFELLGLPITPPGGYVPYNIHQNLAEIGYLNRWMVTPTNYIMDDRTQFVGFIDNGHPEKLAMNYVMNLDVVDLLKNKKIDKSKVPDFERIAVNFGRMQEGTILGHFLRWLLTSAEFEQLPSGSSETVAFIAQLDIGQKAAFEKCQGKFPELENFRGVFSMDEFRSNSRVKRQTRLCNKNMADWFVDKNY